MVLRGDKMEKNVGTVDKVLRGVAAAVFLYLGYRYSYLLWIVTLLLVVTIITGFCWPYRLLGINTNKKK